MGLKFGGKKFDRKTKNQFGEIKFGKNIEILIIAS